MQGEEGGGRPCSLRRPLDAAQEAARLAFLERNETNRRARSEDVCSDENWKLTNQGVNKRQRTRDQTRGGRGFD